MLHDLTEAKKQDPGIYRVSTSVIYFDHCNHSSRVTLKVVPIQIHHGEQSLDTFAARDESTGKTIVLPAEVKFLGLKELKSSY